MPEDVPDTERVEQDERIVLREAEETLGDVPRRGRREAAVAGRHGLAVEDRVVHAERNRLGPVPAVVDDPVGQARESAVGGRDLVAEGQALALTGRQAHLGRHGEDQEGADRGPAARCGRQTLQPCDRLRDEEGEKGEAHVEGAVRVADHVETGERQLEADRRQDERERDAEAGEVRRPGEPVARAAAADHDADEREHPHGEAGAESHALVPAGERGAERPRAGQEEGEPGVEPARAHGALGAAEREVGPERRRDGGHHRERPEQHAGAQAARATGRGGDQRERGERRHGEGEVEGEVEPHERVQHPARDPQHPVLPAQGADEAEPEAQRERHEGREQDLQPERRVEAEGRERERDTSGDRGRDAARLLARVHERRRRAEGVRGEDEHVVLEQRVAGREPERQPDQCLADHVVPEGEGVAERVEDAGVEEVQRSAEERAGDVARRPHEEERVRGAAAEGGGGVRELRGARAEYRERQEREAAERGGDDPPATPHRRRR